MLEDTAGYYSKKARSWVVTYSTPDFMFKIEDCLKAEMGRDYLLPRTLDHLKKAILQVLLSKYNDQFYSDALELLRNGKMEDISRMYMLNYA